jgi:hypothetical protein
MPGPAPYSKGSRSNGSKSKPCAQFIRFTEDENKKLVKLCRSRGLTVQAFGHAAIMHAIDEAQLGKKTVAEVVREEDVAAPEKAMPKGLGIRERLQHDASTTDYDDDAPSTPMPALQAPPQVHTSTIDDQILTLARTIVVSPSTTRRDVMKAACEVLARGRSLEEAIRLGDDLIATIKQLDSTPQTALERVRARMPR